MTTPVRLSRVCHIKRRRKGDRDEENEKYWNSQYPARTFRNGKYGGPADDETSNDETADYEASGSCTASQAPSGDEDKRDASCRIRAGSQEGPEGEEKPEAVCNLIASEGRRVMAKSYIDKMEEAAGISTPEPKMPYGKGESIPGKGGVARPWTGPRPWKGVSLIPRAKGGPVSPGRSKVMKMKGSPLAGFMPGPKKSKKGKKGKKQFAI